MALKQSVSVRAASAEGLRR